MTNHLHADLSTLLGRSLLGVASPEELHELHAARDANSELGHAMDLLESVAPTYQASPFGENEQEVMKNLEMPEFLRPDRLARAYAKDPVSRKGLAFGVAVHVLLGIQALLFGEGLLAQVVGVSLILGAPLLAVAILARSSPARRRRQAHKLAQGGEDWRTLALGLQRIERFSFGPRGKLVFGFGLFLGLVGFGLILGSVFQHDDGSPLLGGIIAGVGMGLAVSVYAYRGMIQHARQER